MFLRRSTSDFEDSVYNLPKTIIGTFSAGKIEKQDPIGEDPAYAPCYKRQSHSPHNQQIP